MTDTTTCKPAFRRQQYSCGFLKFVVSVLANFTTEENARKQMLSVMKVYQGDPELWPRLSSIIVLRHPLERLESFYDDKMNPAYRDSTVAQNKVWTTIEQKIIRSRKVRIENGEYVERITPNELIVWVLSL